MEYAKEQLKLKKLKARDNLAALYADSKTWPEFKLNVDIKLPEASKIDLLACKVYYLKKTRPMCLLFFRLMLFLICVSTSIIPVAGSLFIGPSLYLAFVLAEIHLLDDTIRRIRDKEAIKRMEELWPLKLKF